MKKFLITLVSFVSLFVSCRKDLPDIEIEKKPVKVITAGNETKTVFFRNIGYVTSSDIIKLGFKIPGKVKSVNVKKGDKIKKGYVLARLETKELDLDLLAAENNYRKAEDYYNETASFYGKIKDLFDAGAVPESDHDKAKLAMDVARSDLDNAKVDVDYKKSRLNDAELVAGIEGFVIEVLNKKGEIVPAGYPVAVLRSESMIVKSGVPSKNLKDIKIGTEAVIEIDGTNYAGKVTNIAQMPDERTRTYGVEVSVVGKKSKDLYLGAIAKVDFNVGEEKGVWIPVFSLLNDGSDFVFVVKNGAVIRKNIKTEHISDEFVLVEGLEEGDRVVIEGMKEISDGDKVVEK
jgi:RND family efflux transporter MFP subunit